MNMANIMDRYKMAPAEMEENEADDLAHEVQEELPLDAEVVEQEREEPPEIQALEESLGIEIPRERWDEIMQMINKQKQQEPEKVEDIAPSAGGKPVWQAFGQPQNRG